MGLVAGTSPIVCVDLFKVVTVAYERWSLRLPSIGT